MILRFKVTKKSVLSDLFYTFPDRQFRLIKQKSFIRKNFYLYAVAIVFQSAAESFKIHQMKILFRFLLLTAILFTGTVQAQKKTQKAVINTTINCDHCKMCETCGDLLEKKLLKQPGVQMITLDEKAMTITVIYNSKKTDLPTIKTAISQLGYDADEVKADVLAYEKLDGCCKPS